MTYTTALVAVVLGAMLATAFLYDWFQDDEHLPFDE